MQETEVFLMDAFIMAVDALGKDHGEALGFLKAGESRAPFNSTAPSYGADVGSFQAVQEATEPGSGGADNFPIKVALGITSPEQFLASGKSFHFFPISSLEMEMWAPQDIYPLFPF